MKLVQMSSMGPMSKNQLGIEDCCLFILIVMVEIFQTKGPTWYCWKALYE
jgi:hypothetical protein